MTSLAQRQTLLSLIDEAVAAGARAARACQIVGLSLRTVQRWKLTPHRGDQRPERIQQPANRYSELERQRILSVLNSEEYGHLPPSQIVPRLADRGEYLASESTMYRLLRSVGQLVHRGRQRAPSPYPSRGPSRRERPMKSTVGTSPTCRRPSKVASTICICSWTSSAE